MYRIEWMQFALDELALNWLKSDPLTRKAITVASESIEKQLRLNPQDAGESRNADFRILIEMPLGLFFNVDEDAQLVTIFHLWLIRTRKK